MKVKTAEDYKEEFQDLCNAGYQFHREIADDVSNWHRARKLIKYYESIKGMRMW